MKLTTKILLGLLLGAGVGVAVQALGFAPARDTVVALEPLGTAFIRLISMIVVPLVVASLFVGTCSVGVSLSRRFTTSHRGYPGISTSLLRRRFICS